MDNQKSFDLDKLFEEKLKLNNELNGKCFEKAFCDLYNIKFNGCFKYSFNKVEFFKNKIKNVKNHLDFNFNHNGKQFKYDFEDRNNNIFLSLKFNKKHFKISPQSIGQLTFNKFKLMFDNNIKDKNDIKYYIINNINDLLCNYFENTFNCYLLYFNEYYDILLLINLIDNNINFKNYDINFSHIKKIKFG